MFENDQVSITSIGWSFEDGILTYQAYLENKTDMEVVYSFSDSSVNGTPIWEGLGYSPSVKVGKTGYITVEWGSFELQDFGIAAMVDVDEVAMKYNIYRYDSET